MFLLAANVISELGKAGENKADATVVAWLSSQDAGSLFISVITLLEPEVGTPRAS